MGNEIQNEESKEEVKEVVEESVATANDGTAQEVAETESVEEAQENVIQKAKKHWKILLPLAIILVIALGAWLGRSLFVAAIVDGEPISRLAVIKELEKRSGGQALDTMVIKKIILKRALEQGISISNDDVEGELDTLRDRTSQQGGTLEDALKAEGLTVDQFKEQIILQKALEKILEDKVAVSDDEIKAYLDKTKATKPATMTDEDFKGRIREQLKSQKFGAAAEAWLIEQKQKANIQYFVDYALPLPGQEAGAAPEPAATEQVPATSSSQQ